MSQAQARRPRLVKSVATKDDGRIVVYYDRSADTSHETSDDG